MCASSLKSKPKFATCVLNKIEQIPEKVLVHEDFSACGDHVYGYPSENNKGHLIRLNRVKNLVRKRTR